MFYDLSKNILLFDKYEIYNHPFSDFGVICLIISLIYIYKMYLIYTNTKLMNLKRLINSHKFMFNSSVIWLILFMILSKPLITYYSSDYEWISSISLIGVIMQLKWHHQNNKVLWDIAFNNMSLGKLPDSHIIIIRNYSGVNVQNLIIYDSIDNIQKISDSKKDFIHNKGTKSRIDYIRIKLNPIILKDTNGNYCEPTPVMTNKWLYNIFTNYLSHDYGVYGFNLVFYCKRNQHIEKCDVTYNYSKDRGVSGVIDLV